VASIFAMQSFAASPFTAHRAVLVREAFVAGGAAVDPLSGQFHELRFDPLLLQLREHVPKEQGRVPALPGASLIPTTRIGSPFSRIFVGLATGPRA